MTSASMACNRKKSLFLCNKALVSWQRRRRSDDKVDYGENNQDDINPVLSCDSDGREAVNSGSSGGWRD